MTQEFPDGLYIVRFGIVRVLIHGEEIFEAHQVLMISTCDATVCYHTTMAPVEALYSLVSMILTFKATICYHTHLRLISLDDPHI